MLASPVFVFAAQSCGFNCRKQIAPANLICGRAQRSHKAVAMMAALNFSPQIHQHACWAARVCVRDHQYPLNNR